MEGQELPVGWFETSLGDLIDRIEAGKNFRCIERPPSTGEVGVVKVSAVSWGNFRQDESKTVPVGVELSPGSLIKKGDLLFSRANTIDLVGACVQVASIDKELHLSDKILRLVTNDESLKPWMHRFLSSPGARKHLSEASSGNQLSMRNISQKVLLETAIPLAPLNEQRRIAAKLDTTLAAVDACLQRLDGVAAILKRFRQAVLAAATSGELTREWREKRGIEMVTWRGYEFSSLVREARTGLVRSAAEQHELQEGLVPYLKMDSIGESWGCSHDDLKGVRCEDAEQSTYNLAYGDWLFNTRNSLELVGKSCVWEGPDGVVFNNNILRVRFTSTVRPQWIEIYLRSPGGRDILAAVKSATTSVAAIYQRSLMALEIQAPSLDEQSEIIDRVESFFTLADQLEARLNTARKIVDRLTPALLAKAFRGELVPQDPNDEPASVLLERIRAARQAEAGAGKSSRRGRPKAAANPDQLPLDAAPVPLDFLAGLLRECGALSERALLAASDLDAGRFRRQLEHELKAGSIRDTNEDGKSVLEAVEAP